MHLFKQLPSPAIFLSMKSCSPVTKKKSKPVKLPKCPSSEPAVVDESSSNSPARTLGGGQRELKTGQERQPLFRDTDSLKHKG